MNTRWQFLRRAAPIAAVIAAGALVAVPSAATKATTPYQDAAGDSASAGDITGVTVASDKASGQLVFRISGTNLSASSNAITFLDIDSDANPLTGDVLAGGADYSFGVDDTSYGFFHWNGSDWDYVQLDTPVAGGGNELMISVNAKNIGNPSVFNFSVSTVDMTSKNRDHAPDGGMFNYSIAAGGPDIQSIAVKTTPSGGPRAGKKLVVTPTALTLPPTGTLDVPTPDSYSCRATLGTRRLTGRGTGGCTFSIPKQKSRGKTLTVTITVSYEGASKSFPYRFKVH